MRRKLLKRVDAVACLHLCFLLLFCQRCVEAASAIVQKLQRLFQSLLGEGLTSSELAERRAGSGNLNFGQQYELVRSDFDRHTLGQLVESELASVVLDQDAFARDPVAQMRAEAGAHGLVVAGEAKRDA